MVDRKVVLDEIRRTATENGGVVPGREAFERLTGISEGAWRGKHWLNWSDAVIEAGFTPGRMKEAHSDKHLLASLARLTRELGHFPTQAETRMARVRDPSFPNDKTFARFGEKGDRMAALHAFALTNLEFADVVSLLPKPEAVEVHSTPGDADDLGDGFVYMLKLGKHYKIGLTYDVPRRHRQIDLTLPEKAIKVHSIRTDDPAGIEAYWHKRFAAKNTQGEWFALDAADVRAFKRRRFM